MLKQETINKIASLLKLKPEDLATALKDEKEVDVAIDDTLTVATDKELAGLKKKSYDEGKVAGEEMSVDSVKKDLGLTFEGKTVTLLAKAVAKKTLDDAKIEPEKKVQELQEKLTNLQANYSDLEKQVAAKDGEVIKVKTNAEVSKHIANTSVSPEKVIALMEMDGYSFNLVDGKYIPYKDGKELQDKLSNPFPLKDVVEKYISENNLTVQQQQQQGGRGGKDDKGPKTYLKLSELKAEFEAEGKSTLGQEFAQKVAEAAKVEGFSMAE